MKELSIEEKAKRYDEALKVATKNYEAILEMDDDCTFAKEGIFNTFHHMFPELKESEDEKIRKCLLYHYSKYQSDEIFLNDIKMRDIVAWLEKQKEQPNPYILCKSVKDKIDIYIANHFIADKVVKTDISSIVHAIEEGVKIGLSEQKSVEWSEEDEKKFEAIARVLIGCDCAEKSLKIDGYSLTDIAGWLKSLKDRVHWKPSEEQIEALKFAKNDYVLGNTKRCLESLYIDLKKLM